MSRWRRGGERCGSRPVWGCAVSISSSLSATRPPRNGSIAVAAQVGEGAARGPSGERRQACDERPNASAQWEDSSISRAPSLAQRGHHARLDAAGVLGRSGVRLAGRAEQTQARPAGRTRRRARRSRRSGVVAGDAPCGDDLLVERRGPRLEQRAVVRTVGHGHPFPRLRRAQSTRMVSMTSTAAADAAGPPAAPDEGPGGRAWRVRSAAQAGLQRVELGPQHGGQVVAELLEPLLDLRDLGRHSSASTASAASSASSAHVEAVGVERAGAGTCPIGVSTAAAWPSMPLDDPLQHPAVLAEPGPQEAAVRRRGGTS